MRQTRTWQPGAPCAHVAGDAQCRRSVLGGCGPRGLTWQESCRGEQRFEPGLALRHQLLLGHRQLQHVYDDLRRLGGRLAHDEGLDVPAVRLAVAPADFLEHR